MKMKFFEFEMGFESLVNFVLVEVSTMHYFDLTDETPMF